MGRQESCQCRPRSELSKAPWIELDRSAQMAARRLALPTRPPAFSSCEGEPPLMRLDHMTASLVGLMRVRRHSTAML